MSFVQGAAEHVLIQTEVFALGFSLFAVHLKNLQIRIQREEEIRKRGRSNTNKTFLKQIASDIVFGISPYYQ